MLFDRIDRSFFQKYRTERYQLFYAIAVVIGLLTMTVASLSASAAQPETVKLQASESLSTAGYFNLSWNSVIRDSVTAETASGNDEFVLQQSGSAEFADPIEWHLKKSTSFAMSGLENGTYYYRVGLWPQPEAWSNVVQVEVKHHSLEKALAIFTLGALIFCVLVAVVLINRKQANSGF